MLVGESQRTLFGRIGKINGLIFWQKSKNPVLGEILAIFSKTRLSLSKHKNKLALSDFNP